MDKCPYCGAETRQGDNFCLNCGNRLLPATPSPSQAQSPAAGEPTIAAATEDWAPSAPTNIPLSNSGAGWGGNVDATVAPSTDAVQGREPAPTAQATLDRIPEPGRFVLRSDSGEVLQEYPLDKPEIVIGRAPNSDILLSKDKLTSRRHAVVSYENGQYLLRDEHSANGTFVNGQQLEDGNVYTLQDGDHVGIGEHELLFYAYGSTASSVEDLPTMAVPYDAEHPELSTFRTLSDTSATVPGSVDDYHTQASSDYEAADGGLHADTVPHEASSAEPAAPESPATPLVEEDAAHEAAPENIEAYYSNPLEHADDNPAVPDVEKTPLASDASEHADVTFSRFSTLTSPTLPEMSALTAALAALDGQISSLQERFNATQEAMRNHDSDVTQTANQLRNGIRKVTDRMDGMIADVARNREALSWGDLLQLMEDVMNNPRDIEYVTKLARKARELNKVFQIHQTVLNTMAECNSLLRSMIGDDRQQ